MNKELRKEWYSRTDVLSNLIPLLRGREVAFMVPYSLRENTGNYPVRCIKAHHSSYLLNNMRAFDFFNRKYNLYHSIYTLENMPMFTYQPLRRSEQQKEFFKNYDQYVTGVDFVMDFDGDKTLPLAQRITFAQEQTVKVAKILDRYEIPYCIIFSGSKGFHLEIRDFPTTREWSKRTKIFAKIASLLVLLANGHSLQTARVELGRDDFDQMMKDRYSFDSGIYNVTRIWKVPYSYDVSTDMVVMPLSSEELINFKVEKYHVEEQLKIQHWSKGLKTRKGLLENFWKLAQDLEVDL